MSIFHLAMHITDYAVKTENQDSIYYLPFQGWPGIFEREDVCIDQKLGHSQV